MQYGVSLNKGIAKGEVMFFSSRYENIMSIVPGSAKEELAKLEKACNETTDIMNKRINAAAISGNETEAQVLSGRLLMINDLISRGKCHERLECGNISCERVLFEAKLSIERFFLELDDDFMRERVLDVTYIAELLLESLGIRKSEFPILDRPVILVCDEMPSQEMLFFSRQFIVGLVVRFATKYSDAAILANLWNVPLLTDIIPDRSWDGKLAEIDAVKGTFCVL